MATKAENNQALLDKVNGLITSGEPKDLVYLAEVLKNITDGTTIEEILTTQGDMVIMGASGLEVITKDNLLAGVGGGDNFVKPDNDVALFTKVNQYTISIPAGFKVKVGDATTELVVAYDINLNINGAGGLDTGGRTAGTDYYVFATTSGEFIASANKTLPSGYSLADVKLIGGFHYGLVGEAETATGNKTAADMTKIQGINSYSFWDLKFRAVAGNEGMVLIGSKWYDIYLLNSEHITNGTSKAGATIAAGATDYGRAIPKIPLAYGGDNTLTYGKLTWFQLCEIAKSHGKELIGYDEFPAIAYGVSEGKSSSTDGYETVAGKVEHYPHLTSKYGIEQATGVQYVWGRDLSEDGGTRTWQDQTDSRGQIYAAANSPVAVQLGGNRADGAGAGSRSSSWLHYVWNSGWTVGSRFACDHLKLV